MPQVGVLVRPISEKADKFFDGRWSVACSKRLSLESNCGTRFRAAVTRFCNAGFTSSSAAFSIRSQDSPKGVPWESPSRQRE